MCLIGGLGLCLLFFFFLEVAYERPRLVAFVSDFDPCDLYSPCGVHLCVDGAECEGIFFFLDIDQFGG
jgi:hypothetical protein